jgi:hypothetical protein
MPVADGQPGREVGKITIVIETCQWPQGTHSPLKGAERPVQKDTFTDIYEARKSASRAKTR